MKGLGWLFFWRRKPPLADHLRKGLQGETAARRWLRRHGLKFLTANYRTSHGEIDLVFRDGECLVFVEVKTRSNEDWVRPETAVNADKRRRIIATAEDYVRALRGTYPRWRFDVVEVLIEHDRIREIRHLPNAFPGVQPPKGSRNGLR
jgi:putative endonuclease